MKLEQDPIKKLLFIISFGLILHWGLNHGTVVFGIIQWLVSILMPFLLGLCFAFIINVLLRPIERLWDEIFKKQGKGIKKAKRIVCLLISTGLISGAVFVLLFMLIPEIKRSLTTILDMLPQYGAQLDLWWTELVNQLGKYATVLPEFELNMKEVVKMAGEFLTTSGYTFFNKTFDITTSIFSAVFQVVLGIVFAFYVLAQKEKLRVGTKRLLYAVLPETKVDNIIEVAVLTNKIFTNFVTGQLTEAVIIGVLCFIGMTIISMPYAPMISVLVGFTALIPVFGAFFGTAVGAFLILMVNPMKAVWFVLFIILLQQMEGNLIYPKVVGKSVGLPGIWVLVAVTVGGSAFGILGMLLSVPCFSVLYCLWQRGIDRKLRAKKLDIS